MLDFKHDLFEAYGNISIIETIDAEDFREFVLTFYKKKREKQLHSLYVAAYSQMAAGLIEYKSFDDFIGKNATQTAKEDVETNMKMVERIINSTVRR